MSEQTEQIENLEVNEPLSLQELLAHAVQDVTLGESAEFVADEFFDEFVYQNREETSQILMMLDMPNETIIDALVQTQQQAFETQKQNAPKYLDDLRREIQIRLAEMQKA